MLDICLPQLILMTIFLLLTQSNHTGTIPSPTPYFFWRHLPITIYSDDYSRLLRLIILWYVRPRRYCNHKSGRNYWWRWSPSESLEIAYRNRPLACLGSVKKRWSDNHWDIIITDVQITEIINTVYFNPLSASPPKWSNTLKQFVGN